MNAGKRFDVVDTTTAGDAFPAGFAYSILQGWDMERTLDFANAPGALVCRGLGGRETLPTLPEVRQLKEESVRQSRTMSELVESALRILFSRKEDKQKLPPLPAFHSGGCRVDPANREALYEVMEGIAWDQVK